MPTMPSPSERRIKKKLEPAPEAWAVKTDKLREVVEAGEDAAPKRNQKILQILEVDAGGGGGGRVPVTVPTRSA